jgi:transposase InsO family protein
MDVKHVYLPNGTVYQFTALDHATRVVLVRLYSRITSRCGRDFLRRVQEVFRDIQYVGSDNGSEFLGEFGKELDRQKIPHVFSSPHSPKQNPYVERVIRTIIDEVYLVRGTEYNMQVQQQVLDKYVQEYNHQRPHWSLNLRTPMEQLQLLKSQPS